jgi:hypothetical protein
MTSPPSRQIPVVPMNRALALYPPRFPSRSPIVLVLELVLVLGF